MSRRTLASPLLLPILLIAGPAAAQEPLPREAQITAAVASLPAPLRDGARVLGYRAGSAGLVELRAGTNHLVCLADDPKEENFHTACYHESLDPYMARGRALRAQGLESAKVDSIRDAEVAAKKLAIPAGTAIYNIRAKSFDAASGNMTEPQTWYVVYTPFATPETIGFGTEFAPGTPWIMYPGTSRAHLMIVPPRPAPAAEKKNPS